MPANSATHLIFFIAAVIIALTLVGAFILVINNLTDAMENMSVTEQKSIRSRVEIVNDLVAMPYNNTSKTVDIYVKNTGAERLDANRTLILMDGVNATYTWKMVGGGSNWTVGTTAVFTCAGQYYSANTDHSVKVIAQYGASDRKEFRIGSLP
jgi:archaellum component FlaG (FlaF/FlaG flagellin family)